MLYIRKWKTAFKIIDISIAGECCATWCSFNNTMIFKTTDQMMLDIGGFETEIKYLIIVPFYGTKFSNAQNFFCKNVTQTHERREFFNCLLELFL